MSRRSLLGLALVLFACACASTPRAPIRPGVSRPQAEAGFRLRAAQFSDLPNWTSADLAPALTAYRRQCARWGAMTPDQPMSAGAQYGGAIGPWLAACSAAQAVTPGGERAFFEANFNPASVNFGGGGEARLTAYYEPV